MLENYFLLAIRNLRRNARYLTINVLGLGLALGFCILAYLNYRFANTFDAWHQDADRIYRVEMRKTSNGELYGTCPGALAQAAQNDLPGIEDRTRYDMLGTVVKRGEEVFNETLHFADDNFFQFFDFELLLGSADLSDHNKVLLDEDTAKKYFGSENPVGQTLLFYADTDYKRPLVVGGVLKNIPLNSSLRFRFLTHLDNAYDGPKRLDHQSWARSLPAVFLKTKPGTDVQVISAGLAAYVGPRNTARPDWQVTGYAMEPLKEIAHTSRNLRGNSLWQGVPPAAVWGNMTISILLLLTAALNFSNMTIGISNRRLREMGVRKVLGSSRGQLMRQILTESLLVVLFATGIGMALAYPICEWFNSTWKFTDLRVDYSDPALLLYIVAVIVTTTLMAGSYPAFYISGFRPASIFRGGVLFGGSNLFSRVMMGLQVAISIISVVVGMSFAYNADFNKTADIGFDYQPVLQAWLPSAADYPKFEQSIKNIPGIEKIAGSVHLPGFGFTFLEFKYKEQPQEACVYQVGNGFADIMGIRLVEGAWPTPAGDTTRSPEILVNQTFIRKVSAGGAAIGESITLQGKNYRIAGVVADFMTDSPFMAIHSAVFQLVPQRDTRRCLIRTRDLSCQPQVMAALETQWKSLFPYVPFNVGYQNEMLREAIEVSENIAKNMAVFSVIAILLSVTGLFSLVSLNILRRLREIAIRRVMGASGAHISWIINKNYIWIFSMAVVLGCSTGYVLAKMLMDSIFRISIGVKTEAMAYSALGILLVASLTIGLKIWQTLRVNPANVLRGD
jgi:putative ABC transport system permease protein